MSHGMLPASEAPHLPTPDVCPNCGCKGTLHRERRQEVVRGGDNVAFLPVEVDICSHCHETIYDLRTIGEMQTLQKRLMRGDTADLTPVGTTYTAPALSRASEP